MNAALPQPLPDEISRRLRAIGASRALRKRMGLALLLVLLLHLFFFLVIAPRLDLTTKAPERTEVEQISPQRLAQIKKQIMNRERAPLLKQEMHEELKTKDAPDDAKTMAAFNQKVAKEMVARAQVDAPQDGGGRGRAQPQQKSQESRRQLNLAKLGLGTKLPKQLSPTEAPEGPRGPNAPFRPMGREAKDLEKGDQNMLNAVESKYYSFFARQDEPFVRNWYFLMHSFGGAIQSELVAHGIHEGAELPVTVEFVIDRQGNFKSISITESSGIPTLDHITREAMAKLGSLPNPPPDLFEGAQYYTRAVRISVYISPFVNARPDVNW